MIEMFSEKFEEELDIFKKRYQYVANRMIEWYPISRNEILIKCDDGDEYIYDLVLDKIRDGYRSNRIPDRNNEEKWKREFSARLSNKMASSRIAGYELSKRTGISEVSISKYLHGHSIPSARNIDLIAAALNCTASELIDIS